MQKSLDKTSPEYLQNLYEKNLLKTPEGYISITNIIKSLLMKYLIKAKGGYYKNGEKQNNFDIDDINDCCKYVLDRVYGTYRYKGIKDEPNKPGKQGRVKYDPTRMNLASFVHTWTRGYCSQIRAKAYRRYKKNFHKLIYLEDVLENCKTPSNCIEEFDDDDYDYFVELNEYDNCEEKIKDLNIEDTDLVLFKMWLENKISLDCYNKLCNIY